MSKAHCRSNDPSSCQEPEVNTGEPVTKRPAWHVTGRHVHLNPSPHLLRDPKRCPAHASRACPRGPGATGPGGVQARGGRRSVRTVAPSSQKAGSGVTCLAGTCTRPTPFVLAFGHRPAGCVVCPVRLLCDNCNSVQLMLLHVQDRAGFLQSSWFQFLSNCRMFLNISQS